LSPIQRAPVLLAQVGADERRRDPVAEPGRLDLVGEADDGAPVPGLERVDALRVTAHAAAAAALLDDAVGGRLDGRDLHPAPSPLALDANPGLGALEVGEEVVGEGLVVHEVLEHGVDLLARPFDRCVTVTGFM
jgi:hypothetical protein